jgi:transcriptional regulator GlxA family with amidase domain
MEERASGFLSEQKLKKYPPLVHDAVALIEAEYGYLYGIDELADRLEITKHHLIRVFSASTGITPGNYLISIRMHHARSMLQSCEGTPMEIIAGACGYSCANYFSKVFKKHTGLTPTDYMKSARENAGSETEYLRKFYL